MRAGHCKRICVILLLSCLSCAGTPKSNVQQSLEQRRQVDVITKDGKTVDVREAIRNLHNRKMYLEAWKILVLTKNASLSSPTVKLLITVLNDNSKGVLNDKFEDIRVRAVSLLGLSRNPEAIAILTNRMFSDPAWRVRGTAGTGVGRLAGEAALPALLEALEKRKISNLNGGFLYAGDKAVPIIIQWMEEDFAKNGGKSHAATHVKRLKRIGDRRAIDPLLRIVAHPGSPSDTRIDIVRFDAAEALANFTSEDWYYYGPDKYSKYLAIDPPVRRVNRRVNAFDRKRIVKALQKAGYDVERLIFPFPLSPPDDKGE